MLEEEHPSCIILLYAQTQCEPHMHHGIVESFLDLLLAHPGIVQLVQATEWPTHGASYEHQRSILSQPLECPLPLFGFAEVQRIT